MAKTPKALFRGWAIPGWLLFGWQVLEKLSVLDSVRSIWTGVEPHMMPVLREHSDWIPTVAGALWLTAVVLLSREDREQPSQPKRGWADHLQPWRIRALKSEVREKERQLEQHIEAMTYGNRLLPASPLTPADQRALAEAMREIRTFVDRASETIRSLMAHLLNNLQFANRDHPEADARYWLAFEIRENVLDRIKTMQDRFDAVVEADEDAREALTGFVEWYETGSRWVSAMGVFLAKRIDNSDEYRRWKPCDEQLYKILKEKIALPQFLPVEQYLTSVKRLETIMLQGLPSGRRSEGAPPPESAP